VFFIGYDNYDILLEKKRKQTMNSLNYDFIETIFFSILFTSSSLTSFHFLHTMLKDGQKSFLALGFCIQISSDSFVS